MKPWQWFAVAAGAVGVLWFLFGRTATAPAAAPETSTPASSAPTPTPTIGTVASQFAALSSAGLNVVNIDAVPSTVAVGWLGQPKLVVVPATATPATAPDPAPTIVQVGPGSHHLF